MLQIIITIYRYSKNIIIYFSSRHRFLHFITQPRDGFSLLLLSTPYSTVSNGIYVTYNLPRNAIKIHTYRHTSNKFPHLLSMRSSTPRGVFQEVSSKHANIALLLIAAVHISWSRYVDPTWVFTR